MWASPKEVDQYAVRVGDLLVCEGGDGGRCGIVDEVPDKCIIQNALHRVRALNGNSSRYLNYVMYAVANFGWFDAINSKATIAHFTREKFGSLGVPIPPAIEQLAIVRYLDHVDRRIRRAIHAKQKLIALLDEQKQAIIHQAVTRGLDPNVRLKPSGVEWLGEVPEHWEVMRLKNVAQVQTGLTLGKNYGSSVLAEYPYLRVANVQTGYLNLKHVTTVRVPFTEAAGCKLQYGDVLMTEGGDKDKLGRGCIWRGEIEDCLHQNHIFAVRANLVRLLPEFLVLLMASGHGRNYFEQTAKQTTNLASTNSTTLRAFPLFLPDISEQRLLLDKVVDETTGLDQAIDHAQREIALLREYRTRLIADVVTGKVDVRAAAQGLADEVEEMEPLDEAEVMGDTDEETNDDLEVALREDAE